MTQTTEKPSVKNLMLNQLRIDGGTQPRAAIDEKTVQEYGEEIATGKKLPPVVAFFDGSAHWLADGFHRWHAHNKSNKKTIPTEIRSGTRRDAVLYSVGANATHGLRRTNADKRRAVETLLKDPEWSQWSNNKIAQLCRVSDFLVAEIRSLLTSRTGSETGDSERKFVSKHGTESTMNIAHIGGKKSDEESGNNPAKPAGYDEDEDPFADEAETKAQVLQSGHVTGSHSEKEAHALKGEPTSDLPSAPTKTIIYDTLTGTAKEENLTPQEWLESLPIYRVLSKLPGKGIIARRSLLDYHAIQKALGTFQHHAARCETVKHPDNTMLSNALSVIHKLSHPKDWMICAPCKGAGCNRCGYAGYDSTGAGISPTRVETGEVTL